MPIFKSGNNHVENEQLVNDTGKNIMKMMNNQSKIWKPYDKSALSF
jgi:hypothetical protein